jgi:hypothetical protein
MVRERDRQARGSMMQVSSHSYEQSVSSHSYEGLKGRNSAAKE